MITAFALVLTLYGLSFLFWAAIGCVRFVNERGRWSRVTAPVPSGVGAGLVSAAIYAIWVAGLRYGIEWYGLPVSTSPEAALPAALLLALGWVVAAVLGSRLVAGRLEGLGPRVVFSGAVATTYTLALLPIFWDLAVQTLVSEALAALSVIVLQAVALAGALAGSWRTPAELPSELPERSSISPADVAVLIAAHNEESCIGDCLKSALHIVSPEQIFVGSDGSSDRTCDIVREHGGQVIDFQPNRGKAGALKGVIDHYDLCSRFKAVIILDADSEVEPDYLERGLPLFDDPTVSAVAGHVVAKWHPHRWPRWSMLFAAYRVRLYRLLQAMLRYGQTWSHTNVSYIIPGAGSIYRTDVIPWIDITAPGLIIEDFNMTFELHHKGLGRIAYSPDVRFTSEDPISLRDYWSQVRRWNLGFWQTVLFQGMWPSGFWLALGTFIVELSVISAFLVVVPLLVIVTVGEALGWLSVPTLSVLGLPLDLQDLFLTLVVADYALTMIVSAIERKPILLVYGGAFMLLRWIDALLYLWTLPRAFFEKSSGSWTSPKRTEAA